MDWNKLDKLEKYVFAGSGFLLFISLISVGIYFGKFWGSLSTDQSHWGLFGEYVGGFAGMFISLVAVFLIFITYRLQQRELTETKDALNAQNEQLKIQQFQNILFNLLERKDLLLKSININRKQGIEALGTIKSKINVLVRDKFLEKVGNKKEARKKALALYWKSHKSQLLPYFNTFSSTVAYLYGFEPSSKREIKAKEQGFRIFSSNLTSNEKITLKHILEYFEVHEPENNEVNACREYLNEYMVLN